MGRPAIVRGSEQIPPYILFIQTNERWKERQHLVYGQVENAVRADVHVVSFGTSLASIYDSGDFTHLDDTVTWTLKHNPKTLVIPRVWLGLGGSWGKEHPDQVFGRPENGLTTRKPPGTGLPGGRKKNTAAIRPWPLPGEGR